MVFGYQYEKNFKMQVEISSKHAKAYSNLKKLMEQGKGL